MWVGQACEIVPQWRFHYHCSYSFSRFVINDYKLTCSPSFRSIVLEFVFFYENRNSRANRMTGGRQICLFVILPSVEIDLSSVNKTHVEERRLCVKSRRQLKMLCSWMKHEKQTARETWTSEWTNDRKDNEHQVPSLSILFTEFDILPKKCERTHSWTSDRTKLGHIRARMLEGY